MIRTIARILVIRLMATLDLHAGFSNGKLPQAPVVRTAMYTSGSPAASEISELLCRASSPSCADLLNSSAFAVSSCM